MRLPEGKQGFFTSAVDTSDSIQIDFDVRLGVSNTGGSLWADIPPIPRPTVH